MKSNITLHLFCSHSANSIPMIPLLLKEWSGEMAIRVYHFNIKAFAQLPSSVEEERFHTFSDRASSLQRGSVFNLKRNLWLLYKMNQVLRSKGPKAVYCIDDTSLKLLLLALKLLPKPSDCRLFYHEFENVDHFNKLFSSKSLGQKDFTKISVAIAPERNRLDKLLGNLGLPSQNGRMIPNTCYAQKADHLPAHPLFSTLPEGKKIICHIGGLGAGSHYFKQVFDSLPNEAVFLQIGTTDQKIDAYVGAHPSRDRFVHAGQLPHAELASIYPYVDFGLILYKGINFNYEFCAPNKLYEFWSFGVPVIAHRLGGLQPLFDTKVKGHLFDLDASSLKADLTGWIGSFDKRNSKEQLIEIFSKEYDMKHFARSMGETIINAF